MKICYLLFKGLSFYWLASRFLVKVTIVHIDGEKRFNYLGYLIVHKKEPFICSRTEVYLCSRTEVNAAGNNDAAGHKDKE